MSELPQGHQLKHYRIVSPLGRGGMGVVYRALDDRLGREVAIKMIAGLANRESLARFWREARTAASVNHPNACQIFDVDESADGVFLAMELLEGEPLDARLARGSINVQDAVPIVSGILGALGALHARGLVHRDIKPSNVFLTPHGAKLLDFGLARSVDVATVRLDRPQDGAVTEAGMILGTPLYMSPEQVRGMELDGRTDIYSVGAMLFHMLAGRPPFAGAGVDVMYAAMHQQPPALEGPPAVVAIDRVIRRAMHKEAAARFAKADEMAAALNDVSLSGATAMAVPVGALTRVIVPPIRLAKPDPDVAFLSMGLAETVSGSLASVDHIVVRSPGVAARWDENADPRKLASEADVDLVISSRMLRSGPQLRISAQLLDSMGNVVGSTTVNGSMDDIFALEDAFSGAALELLRKHGAHLAPATSTDATRRNVPANPRTFELFLRGMEHARYLEQTPQARDFFLQAVAEDAGFAPAWAALGRAHRVYGKYYGERAQNLLRSEEAFRRALELSPDLPAAHRYYTHLEAEMGRAPAAIERLLMHAKHNRRDPQLFAGLVHALRYGGLIDASIAAHDEARRLDPNVPTGVEYARVHQVATLDDALRRVQEWHVGDPFDNLWPVLAFGVKDQRVLDSVSRMDHSHMPPAYRASVEAVLAALMEPLEVAKAKLETAVTVHDDPEGLFFFGAAFIQIGEQARALELLERNVRAGYAAFTLLDRCFAFDPVRDHDRFRSALERARVDRDRAQDAFLRGGGPELLGLN